MNKVIEFDYSYLRACFPHSAKNDVRFYMCGIYLGDGFMSATDGHKMIMIDDECFNGCDYIIPRNVIEFFIKKLGTNPMNSSVKLTIGDDGFNIMELMDRYEYFKFIDGKFPDIKRVDIPKPEKSEGHPMFNVSYMADFVKSLKILSKSNHADGLSILTRGNTESAYVELTENSHGIIMPMRV